MAQCHAGLQGNVIACCCKHAIGLSAAIKQFSDDLFRASGRYRDVTVFRGYDDERY